MSKSGLLFAVVGPTGVGKNALMNDALAQLTPLRQMPTMTTRPQRPGEAHGRERIFVSREVFQQKIDAHALLEWQEVHTDRFYGVPRQALEDALAQGESLIADIDVLGATYIRSVYPEHVFMIYVRPPSLNVLSDRMQTRGDAESDIEGRLPRVEMELAYVPVADYVVVNDNFERAAQHFRQIVADLQQQPAVPGRQFVHTVTSIPIYQGDVLTLAEDRPFSTVELLAAEIPHEAALRSVGDSLGIETSAEQLLRIKATKGSFISPIHIEVTNDGSVKHIRFSYVYLLTERIPAPEGWRWQNSAELDLPPNARELLRELSG